MQGLIPAGYLYKLVVPRPEWLGAVGHVENVYSISHCISDNFADYIGHWRHNGCWLFDDPAIMREIAREQGVPLEGATLFYYEIYAEEFDERARAWSPLPLDPTTMHVTPPSTKQLHGFDVNCASMRNAPECSPLSCNGICAELPVNTHCLMETLEAARAALESGAFDNSEPGPFRIYAVYTVLAL